MSVLNDLRNDVATASAASAAAAAAAATSASKADRKPSDFWLNIGIWVANPDADASEPLFVSLPVGLPLDDMKPQAIRGTNQAWIDLAQTKNQVLEFLQKHAASMAPGERQALGTPVIGQFGVEIYRRNEPQQHGTTEGNPLMASLMASLPKAA